MTLPLNVKLLTGELHSLVVSGSMTIWALKVQIASKTGVSPYQQKLACQNGGYTELNDDSALLSSYPLKAGDTILLMVKNVEPITIFLQNGKGRTSTYSVLPSEGVASFKARVEQQEQIQSDQFWLNYQGKQLENGCKLGDYNIPSRSTIFQHLRLRGG